MGWHQKKVKISAFVLTTNNIERQYPVIESIQSWLPVVDELVIVDGHSTDGTVEAIEQLKDPKIRIIQDVGTKWEEEWFYSRMGKNFDRGFQECTGDIIIKFDADYVLHEQAYGHIKQNLDFRKDCQIMFNAKRLSMRFTRMNFVIWDLGYAKSAKTLAINKTQCLEEGMDVHYGLDLKRWGWGYDFVNKTHEENGLIFGDQIRSGFNSYTSCAYVFNYDYLFTTQEVAKPMRHQHFLAEVKQRNLDYKTIENNKYSFTVEQVRNNPEIAWEKYKEQCIKNLIRSSSSMPIDIHPFLVQDRIKKIQPEHQGYNVWGWHNKI